MSLEKSGENSEFLESEEKTVDIDFNSDDKLYSDALSAWAPVIPFFIDQDFIDNFPDVMHYEEFLRSQEANYPGIYKYAMKLSDAESIKSFDQLVDEFNADKERIKKEKDFDVIKNYYIKKARKIIRGLL